MRSAAIVTIALAMLLGSEPALRAQRPLGDEAILDYLNQTVVWYRDVATAVQAPLGSQDALFADALRRSSTQALQLGFDFARAQAAIPSAASGVTTGPEDPRSRNLAHAEAEAEQRAAETQSEIEQLDRRLKTADARSYPSSGRSGTR